MMTRVVLESGDAHIEGSFSAGARQKGQTMEGGRSAHCGLSSKQIKLLV